MHEHVMRAVIGADSVLLYVQMMSATVTTAP